MWHRAELAVHPKQEVTQGEGAVKLADARTGDGGVSGVSGGGRGGGVSSGGSVGSVGSSGGGGGTAPASPPRRLALVMGGGRLAHELPEPYGQLCSRPSAAVLAAVAVEDSKAPGGLVELLCDHSILHGVSPALEAGVGPRDHGGATR